MTKLLTLILASSILVGCGGPRSSDTTPIASNKSLGGLWRGPMMTPSGASVTGFMLVTADGHFAAEADNIADHCADVSQGALTASGATFTGQENVGIIDYNVSIGVQIDCAYSDGAVSGKGTLTGNVVESATLSTNNEATTSFGGVLPSGSANLIYDALYDQPSSLDIVAGTWTLLTGATISVSAEGAINSQDTNNGCTETGKVSVIDPIHNAYALSVSFAGCGDSAAALDGLTGTGLLMINNAVTPNTLQAVYSLTLADGTVLTGALYATN
jgi:hypothetical protein